MTAALVLGLAACPSKERPAQASPPPEAAKPTAPARPDSEDQQVLAEWPGGSVTVADFRAELDRRAPPFRDDSERWRTQVVQGLAALAQLDALARTQSRAGATAIERVRAMLGPLPPTASDDERLEHVKRFHALLRANVAPAKLLAPAALMRVGPSEHAGEPRDLSGWRAQALHTRFPSGEALTGQTYPGGAFLLDFDAEDGLSPLDWLYLDLAWGGAPRLSDGSWAPYLPARVTSGAGTSNTWKAMPPGAPAGDRLLERYAVGVEVTERAASVPESDARGFAERLAGALRVCVARTVWDHRSARGAVAFKVELKHGEPKVTGAEPQLDGLVPNRVPSVSVSLHDVARCAVTVTRWRFPSTVDGSLTLRASYTGRPWTDDEQELSLTGKVSDEAIYVPVEIITIPTPDPAPAPEPPAPPKPAPPKPARAQLKTPPGSIDIPAVSAPNQNLDAMAFIGLVTLRVSGAPEGSPQVESLRSRLSMMARCALVEASYDNGFMRRRAGTLVSISANLTKEGFRATDNPLRNKNLERCMAGHTGQALPETGVIRVSLIIERGVTPGR